MTLKSSINNHKTEYKANYSKNHYYNRTPIQKLTPLYGEHIQEKPILCQLFCDLVVSINVLDFIQFFKGINQFFNSVLHLGIDDYSVLWNPADFCS